MTQTNQQQKSQHRAGNLQAPRELIFVGTTTEAEFTSVHRLHKTYIIHGPQGIGKTKYAEALFSMLRCVFLVDDWNGKDELRPGSLAITNGKYVMPEAAVAFHVEDAAGLNSLIQTLSI